MFTDWTNLNLRLEQLDLSYNKISHIRLEDITFFTQQITVNLTHNLIEEITFGGYEINMLSNKQMKRHQIYIGDNPLHCDCRMMHFITYLNDVRIERSIDFVAGHLVCAGPETLAGHRVFELNPQKLLCLLDSPKSSVPLCPAGCECFVRTFDRALILNCSNAGLRHVPDIPEIPALNLTELWLENNRIDRLPSIRNRTNNFERVTEIHARNNSIVELNEDNVPPQLSVFDVEANRLSHLNASVLNALNGTRQLRQLRLSANPWQCECSARDFLLFSQDHRHIIADMASIKCVGDNVLLKEKEIRDFCPDDRAVVIAVAIVMALLGCSVGIMAALYYKYQQEIKVWLFAHNMMVWFVTEMEVDQHKKYDGFVSYSHLDEEFVTESILPELENGSPPFKLCWHERDWMGGVPIAQSVSFGFNSFELDFLQFFLFTDYRIG